MIYYLIIKKIDPIITRMMYEGIKNVNLTIQIILDLHYIFNRQLMDLGCSISQVFCRMIIY